MKQILVVSLLALVLLARCNSQPKPPKLTVVPGWENVLDNEEYYIMVKRGTERPFSSVLNNEKRAGYYVSAATGDTLFMSTAKFNSGTGWPSFDNATDKVVLGQREQGGYEVIEKSTGLHLGHLFLNEGFTDENKRYCINGDALEFHPVQ